MTAYIRKLRREQWKRSYNRYLRKKQKLEDAYARLNITAPSYEFDFPINQ